MSLVSQPYMYVTTWVNNLYLYIFEKYYMFSKAMLIHTSTNRLHIPTKCTSGGISIYMVHGLCIDIAFGSIPFACSSTIDSLAFRIAVPRS